MDTQELLVHNSSERKSAERLHASLVHGLGVFVLALKLEGEVIGQMATFMVTAHEPESVGVPDFESPEVENTLHIMSDRRGAERAGRAYLNTEISTVDVVTQEEIACVCRVATNFEQLHQIVVLAMNITADGNGGIHLQKVGLSLENLCTLAQDP